MRTAYNEVQKRAVAKYNAKAYDEIKLRVPKGNKEKIQEFAKSKDKSVNSFINELIDNAMTETGGSLHSTSPDEAPE